MSDEAALEAQLQAEDDAREARAVEAEKEAQKQALIGTILTEVALLPFGVPGMALSLALEYGDDLVAALPKNRASHRASDRAQKRSKAVSDAISQRQNEAELLAIDRNPLWYESRWNTLNDAQKQRLVALRNTPFYKSTVLHQANYAQNVPTKSANVGPMTYIAPVVNKIASRDSQTTAAIVAQEQRNLAALRQQGLGLQAKQQTELEALQRSQKSYYATLQAEANKQIAARNQYSNAEAAQKAQAERAQQAQRLADERSRSAQPQRRLPPTVGLNGAILRR